MDSSTEAGRSGHGSGTRVPGGTIAKEHSSSIFSLDLPTSKPPGTPMANLSGFSGSSEASIGTYINKTNNHHEALLLVARVYK
jgi:hypothetical protein